MEDRLRLTDILTTSAAVANFIGDREVGARHMLLAIAVLKGEKSLDDLGRPLSPLVSRMTGAGSGATDGVRLLAQRWFAQQHGDVRYEFSAEQLQELEEDISRLAAAESELPTQTFGAKVDPS